MKTLSALAGAAIALAAMPAAAQLVHFDARASLDRWMYPFNGTPGIRLSASTFGSPRLDGFDDYDAQFIVGFDTSADIPAGLDPSAYRIVSITVYTSVSNHEQFRFDPTYDAHNTYDSQEGGYPDLVPDADLGRPITLWGLGYRDGFTMTSWTETSPFGFNPVVPPAQGARTAFIATFDAAGNPTDVSNQLKEGVDRTPLAIGQTDAAAPGELVPADATFSFEVNLCDPGVRAYLRQSLAAGQLRFGVASLSPADGSPSGGSGDVTYPVWYTRENPIAQIFDLAPLIEAVVRVGNAGDYNGDGLRNFFDVSAFISDFNAGSPAADMNSDCALNFFDVSAFIAEFNAQ